MLRAAASGAVVRAGGIAARTRTYSNCLNTGKENLGDKVGGRFSAEQADARFCTRNFFGDLLSNVLTLIVSGH